MVQYLRKQQDILSAELQLAKQESARLRSDAATARRAAEAANAQLAGQAERSRASARTEEEHAALMQKMEQLNLLRESNAALRCGTFLARISPVRTASNIHICQANTGCINYLIAGRTTSAFSTT